MSKLNQSELVLQVLQKNTWLTRMNISIQLSGFSSKQIRGTVVYLLKLNYVRSRAKRGKNFGLISNSYQYAITKKGLDYLNVRKTISIKEENEEITRITKKIISKTRQASIIFTGEHFLSWRPTKANNLAMKKIISQVKEELNINLTVNKITEKPEPQRGKKL